MAHLAILDNQGSNGGSDLRAGSRLSACAARRGMGDRRDVGEHAAGVPGWEGSYQCRGAIELDAALAGGLSPRQLAGVPFDEGFGLRGDEEILVDARTRLADLGVSELDEEPIAFTVRAAGKVESDDDASIRKPVSTERMAHRPQRHEGVEVLGGDLEPARTPLTERLAYLEEIVARRRELVVVPPPVGLGCRLDDTQLFELLEPL